MTKSIKLSIRPMKVPGRTVKIPVSKIESGMVSNEIPEAVVAYVDILGFSKKRDDADIQSALLDFSGVLTEFWFAEE